MIPPPHPLVYVYSEISELVRRVNIIFFKESLSIEYLGRRVDAKVEDILPWEL